MRLLFPGIMLGIMLGIPQLLHAKEFQWPYDIKLNVQGYLGWKQIVSNVDYDAVPSSPEIGLLAAIKVTDRLNLFNQFQYGTDVQKVLVYSQIAYTPYIPVDDFSLTLKAGKLRHDNTLYNITKVNPRTRIGVFQPQSLYFSTLGQSITSGVGLGFEFKYKNLSGSYVIDKLTIDDPVDQSKAWTTRFFDNMRSEFGGHQTASLQYEIPDYGVRIKSSWSKLKFQGDIPISQQKEAPFGAEIITSGIEWQHDRWQASIEGAVTKRDGHGWSHYDELSVGYSGVIAYDLTDNITIRGNYNQFRSAVPNRYNQERYNKDLNVGVNWHSGPWMANLEGHWIRGGRIVAPESFASNPGDYKSFYVIGMNLVWFWG